MKTLNASAEEFTPLIISRPNGKPKKTKEQRGHRKRRKKKKTTTIFEEKIDYSKKIDIILKNFETHYSENDLINQSEDEIDDQNEKLERLKWREWSNYACEVERQRRIRILQEISIEEENERRNRRLWAKEALEKERNERISSQFLASLCSTQWFEETVSTYSEDYDLVCPYYKLGCRVSCRRLTLYKHLKECPYTIEVKGDDVFEINYELVCPSSSMGCTYIGIRSDLHNHLITCPFKGMSREEEEEERKKEREKVSVLVEEERTRRVFEEKDSTVNKSVLLHNLLHTQLQNVVTQLHEEVALFYENIKKVQENTKEQYDNIISKVSSAMKQLWPSAEIKVFGSVAAKLHTKKSDIDLVVCFPDNFQYLINNIGTIPFIQVLANYLEREATNTLRINAVHLYAQVPVIKVSCLNSDIPIDISINGHHHSGLSSTEMILTIQHFLKPLSPLLILIKEYMKNKDLNDAYRGGLSSYGIFLLVLLLNLKKMTAHKVSKEISSPVNVTKQSKKATYSSNSNIYSNKILSHITHYNHLENALPIVNKMILFPRLPEAAHVESWEFIAKQRQRGKKTALSVLGLDEDDFDAYSESQLLTTDDNIYGVMLNEFLVVFGEQFQSEKHGFSLRNSGFSFDPQSHPWSNDPLIIEDPLNYLNNVGRNSYKVQHFQRVMGDAHEILKNITVRHGTHNTQNDKTDFLLSEIFGIEMK